MSNTNTPADMTEEDEQALIKLTIRFHDAMQMLGWSTDQIRLACWCFAGGTVAPGAARWKAWAESVGRKSALANGFKEGVPS